MKISILGVPYTLLFRLKDKDDTLGSYDGYCDCSAKRIVVRDFTDAERQDPDAQRNLDLYRNKCLRHEIIHAFLHESGLDINSVECESWATNEEMVDWIAIQGPKICAAWKTAGCL